MADAVETYVMLVAAGAPELPEGFFYRIRRDYRTAMGESIVVELREHAPTRLRPKRSVRWSKIESSPFYQDTPDGRGEERVTSPLEHVAQLCSRVHARLEESIENRGLWNDYGTLEGDHP